MNKAPPTPEITKIESPKFNFPRETSIMPPLTRICPRNCLVDLSAQMAFNLNKLRCTFPRFDNVLGFRFKDETLEYEGFELETQRCRKFTSGLVSPRDRSPKELTNIPLPGYPKRTRTKYASNLRVREI